MLTGCTTPPLIFLPDVVLGPASGSYFPVTVSGCDFPVRPWRALLGEWVTGTEGGDVGDISPAWLEWALSLQPESSRLPWTHRAGDV